MVRQPWSPWVMRQFFIFWELRWYWDEKLPTTYDSLIKRPPGLLSPIPCAMRPILGFMDQSHTYDHTLEPLRVQASRQPFMMWDFVSKAFEAGMTPWLDQLSEQPVPHVSITLQSGLCSSKNHCFRQYVFALENVRGGGEHLHVFHLSHMSRTAHYLVANYTICTTTIGQWIASNGCC